MTSPNLDIYCLAIGGTGMAPLACLLQEQGHRVRGTDGPLYPPMSTLLEQAGIHPLTGYDPGHLEPRRKVSPEHVVVLPNNTLERTVATVAAPCSRLNCVLAGAGSHRGGPLN